MFNIIFITKMKQVVFLLFLLKLLDSKGGLAHDLVIVLDQVWVLFCVWTNVWAQAWIVGPAFTEQKGLDQSAKLF